MKEQKIEMEYPNITLKVVNQTPTIQLHTDEQTQKEIYRMDQGLDTLLMKAADIVGLHTIDNDAELYEIIRNSDDTGIDFPEIEAEEGDSKLSFDYLLKNLPGKMQAQTFPLEVTAAVKDQMTEYLQGDLLAGLLEEVYVQLIKRVLAAAQTMEINNFVLDDERLEPRLREKMAKELAVINADLIVI